jgi:hypothetical protein
MTLAKIDIGCEFGRGWTLFKENMGLFVMAALLAMVLTLISCGILSGSMTAGLFLVIERLINKDPVKPQAGDIFKGLDFFVQSLLLFIILMALGFLLGIIPVVGQIAGFLLGSIMMWGMMFVAYEKLSAMDALKKIYTLTKTGDFTMPLVLGVIANLVAGLGVIACGIGILFTMPFAYCVMACCYQTLFVDAAARPVQMSVDAEKPPPPPPDIRL